MPENHIARGLCGPLNYFVSENFVYDLQNNIPFQQSIHLNEEQLLNNIRIRKEF